MARGQRPLIRHRRDSSLTARFPRSVTAVRADKEVIDFLTNCGNKNLQYLLVPSRLEAALAQLDSDRDGEIDCNEWCVSESETWGERSTRRRRRRGSPVGVPRREDAIETALRNKLAQRAKAREAQAKAAAKEIAKFTSEFLNAARQCFIMSARGARHSTSNLRASRRRRGSYAVDASRRPPPGSRAGSTRTTPGRSKSRRLFEP